MGTQSRDSVSSGTKLPNLANKLQSALERGNVKISDSCDDIATWIGTDPKALIATMDEYNSCCDSGCDSFAKDRRYLSALRSAPYYALKYNLSFHSSLGGIKTNHHMEVLDCQGTSIPGLYAAGIDVGGWETEVYDTNLSGSALGFSLNSGRIAGENAAKLILEE